MSTNIHLVYYLFNAINNAAKKAATDTESTETDFKLHFVLHSLSLVLFMTTRIGVMSCGTAGPLGSVPGMWNHLQGDQVN